MRIMKLPPKSIDLQMPRLVLIPCVAASGDERWPIRGAMKQEPDEGGLFLLKALAIAWFLLFLLVPVSGHAQEMRHMHSAGHMHAAGSVADRPGKEIRQTVIKDFTLTYRLLDPTERNEMMKSMEGHSVLGMKKVSDITNHLMVYIQKPDGKIVPGDVAFLIKGPDGKEFRTMTMGMYGGYGADVNLGPKGTYTITSRIITEGRDHVKLDDEFTFDVK